MDDTVCTMNAWGCCSHMMEQESHAVLRGPSLLSIPLPLYLRPLT